MGHWESRMLDKMDLWFNPAAWLFMCSYDSISTCFNMFTNGEGKVGKVQENYWEYIILHTENVIDEECIGT